VGVLRELLDVVRVGANKPLLRELLVGAKLVTGRLVRPDDLP